MPFYPGKYERNLFSRLPRGHRHVRFPHRRSVLRAGAALCSLTIAGCLGDDDGDGDSDGDDGTGNESDADGTQPGDTGGNGTDSDGTGADDNTDGEDPGGNDPDWETIDTWPQLQYDAHNTGYVHAEAPTDVEELWNVEVGDGVVGSPVVADGTVYVRTPSGSVHAIEEGEVVWEADLSFYRRTEGTPVIHENLLVAAVEGGLVGLDRDGGDIAWEHSIADNPRRLTLADGTVYLANFSNEMYAVEAAGGEQRWEEVAGGPSGAGFYGTPAVYEDEVFVPMSGGDSPDAPPQLRALNLEEGWQRPAIQADVSINTGVAIRDDTFYLGADDGVYTFDPGGEELWHYSTDRPVNELPAITSDAVFGLTSNQDREGNLHCLGKVSGNQKWSAKTSVPHDVSPIVVGEQVASGRNVDYVTGWATDDGEEIWKIQTKIGSFGRLAFADGTYYGGSVRGTVYAWG